MQAQASQEPIELRCTNTCMGGNEGTGAGWR